MKVRVVGNWKMHGTQHEAVALAREVLKGLRGRRRVDVVLAPPFTALGPVRKTLRGSALRLAGQNVHWEEQGAFTGEISAKMLRELGCHFAIVGHSERRRRSRQAGLTPLFAGCSRNSLEQSEPSRRESFTAAACVPITLASWHARGKSTVSW